MSYRLKLIGKRIMDIVFVPLTWLGALWYRFMVRKGIWFFPVSESILMKCGVLPVIDHYYFPLINPSRYLARSLQDDRDLPGIDMNIAEQLSLFQKFDYSSELTALPFEGKTNSDQYYYNNRMFGPGDAEILYGMIRHLKPERIIEIGSGYSTLMSLKAIEANKKELPAYQCDLVCIEPYEIRWLEKLNVRLNRVRVEDLDISAFSSLRENDILLIDSSHVIRPQGDVLFEFLQVLPLLNNGVIVHIHDIFTPKDYPKEWVIRDHKLWNEQYLLEAFMTNNAHFKVIGSLNHLFHHHADELFQCCPVLKDHPEWEPRSFWIRKIK